MSVRQWLERLHAEIQEAMGATPPRPVNMGRYRHGVLVRGLHGEVYGKGFSEETLGRVRVTYPDGTEGKPFPLKCLSPPPEPDPKEYVLRIGLNSGRHPELDRLIEMYLFRNSEVNEWESAAEQEQEAYLRAHAFLGDSFWKEGGIIELYQTGLEPLIIGFYRAAVEVARSRTRANLPRLLVIPKVFQPTRISLNWFLKRQTVKKISSTGISTQVSRMEDAIGSLSREVSGFFDLSRDQEEVSLEWIPSRPMWVAEHDYLQKRAHPSLQLLLMEVYRRSQFPTVPTWG